MKKILLLTLVLFIITNKLVAQTILGIDVYHGQGTISWQQVKATGVTFAWSKATDGLGTTDNMFLTNMTNGNSAGVVMGAYHFARPYEHTALDEANYFLSVASSYIKAGNLPPVVDIEDPSDHPTIFLSNYFTAATLTAWVQTWVTTVKNATGITPIIYTNSNYAAYLNSSLNIYNLWIAKPDGSSTTPPTGLGSWSNWAFKQYSWTGSVSGISSSVDLDVFNGSMTAFDNLIGVNNCTAITLGQLPINQTVTAPASASFSCSASAGTSISYQWEYSTNAGSTWNSVPNSSPYSNVNSPTLSISSSSATMNGYMYRCHLFNSCSSPYTNWVTLTVNSCTQITLGTLPINQAVTAPASASFSCSASAGTSISYQWEYSTNAGSTWNSVPNSSPYSNVNSPTLSISSSSATMNGYMYRCHLFNSCSSPYTNWVTLTVNSCTQITLGMLPVNQIVTAPSSASFSCSASAGSSISYQWEYSIDAGNSWNSVPNSSPYSNVNSPTLSIGPSTITMNGYMYRCHLFNSCSSPYTNWVTLAVNPPLSSDANLSSLVISNGTLSPSFTPGTTNYSVTVGNSVSQITFTPTVENSSATLTVNNLSVNSGAVSQGIFLNVGNNTIPIIVYAQDGTPKTYNITITRAPSADANLSGLLVLNGVLFPSFSPGTNNYSISENNDVSQVNFTPLVEDNTASVTVNGLTVASGSTSQGIFLNVGTTTIPITVTAQAGNTNTYSITVTRAPSSDANLSGLLASNGTLSPSFSGGINDYSISVDNNVSQISFTPTVEDNTASVTVNNLTVASGSASQGIFLNVGINTIPITVTAQEGKTNTYYITVTRAPSSDANLSGLLASNGTLSPSFSAGTNSYSISVVNNVSQISFTPTVEDNTASLTVNGLTVASGSTSQGIFLNVGTTTIPITVTAQGGNTNTYSISVTRAPSSDANLSGLLASNGTLSPSFSAGTNSYSISVVNNVSQISFTPTVEDNTASITVNGLIVASGSTSQGIFLNVGTTTIPITVTAQGGNRNTYSISVTRAPSSNANLANLSLSNGTLTPAFSPSTFNYTASVNNTVSSVTITPGTQDVNATITVNGLSLTSGTVSNPINLNVGVNPITVVVTAQDGLTKTTYTISVTRSLPSIADLSALTLSNGHLTQPFTPTTTLDSTFVGNGVKTFTITPTAADPAATIAVNGTVVASGTPSQYLPLTVGFTTITIVVTAQDGITQKTYKLLVNEARSSVNTLSGLKLSSGALTPAFFVNTTSYTQSVANNISSVTVTPTTTDPTATVTVNGATVASGTPSASIPLALGANTITTVVTAQNLVTKTYTVTVTRQASSNADLSALTVSNGHLTQPFTPATTLDSTFVGNGVKTFTVTPTAADPTATITVNGSAVLSGTASPYLPLTVGFTTINIVVTAQDGTTKKTYVLLVNEARSSVNTLSGLNVSTGTLTPVFATNTTSYTQSVPNNISSVTVTPITTDATATVTVNGTTVTWGSASANIPLVAGANTITTVVTAQNLTTKTYTITITRAPSTNANLANLTPSKGILSPAFATTTGSYTDVVTNGTASVTLTPTLTDATASVTVNGATVKSGSPSGAIALSVGTNTITTIVTAQDGTTKKTYTVSVIRPSTNAKLSELTISSGTLTPVFNTNTTNYTTSVANTISSITLTPTVAVAGSTIKVNGTTVISGAPSAAIALGVGGNTITTVVTAQDGVTTDTYTVTVTRAGSANCNLSSLIPSKGTLSPVFAASTINYTVMLTNGTTSVTVTPTTQVTTSTITVNGITLVSGHASGAISLAVGSNTITIVVTAQDGSTKRSYTVNAIRPSTNAKLSLLKISSGTLTPAFNTNTVTYTDAVTNATTSVTVTPTVAATGATVKVNGTTVASGIASGAIALSVGSNKITTVLTAQDGVTTDTYTITVTRAAAGANIPDVAVGVQNFEPLRMSDDGINVHQGISPNGDGIDDFLQIDNISQFPDNNLKIMNRNGLLVYEAKGYDNSTKPFDGHSNKTGQMQLPGTYFYSLDYTVKGVIKHKTGFLVLKY